MGEGSSSPRPLSHLGRYIPNGPCADVDTVDSVERVLWWLFGSSIGAATRARILLAIREQPRNTQQLAEALGLDYTTVRHHLRVLGRNGLVATAGDRYGQVYFLSASMESHWDAFERITENVRGTGDRLAGK
jgi:DNA-binding transcriptional ArsR family regulator